ncbi:MAG: tRNA uridine-5-carboxymethylaminomethyl(34) synthesis GTPase MnmE, partial [Gammaproteobacteria bacterium]
MAKPPAPSNRSKKSTSSDTIAAVATPPGRGGLGVVRVSGPLVPPIAEAVLGQLPQPRYATYGPFQDGAGETLDNGIALFFPAPRSYTGEDVLELHAHGSPVVLDRLVERIVALGARLARPGEYTERAYMNGKLALAQAEAVADLIDSSTVAAARSAIRSLQGELSQRVSSIVEAIKDQRTHMEAAIDFPDEGIETSVICRHRARLKAVLADTERLLGEAYQGQVLSQGLRIAIAGPPNVGKSSLLNRLARAERAIVTDVPGTTRDAIQVEIDLNGLRIELTDTAGLRDTADPVEQEGIRKTERVLGEVDHVLYVRDHLNASEAFVRDPGYPPYTLVHNKIDLSGREPALRRENGCTEVFLSARTGAGLDLLTRHLKQVAGLTEGSGAFAARRRHVEALRRAGQALREGLHALVHGVGLELVAEDLRRAQ